MKRLLIFAMVALFAACTPSKEKLAQRIADAEAALYPSDAQDFKFDENLARETVAAYEAFVEQYPQDTASPEYLFKSAELHRTLKEYDKAINIYRTIELEYPNSGKVAHSLFLQAYVYENEVQDLAQAREKYEDFLWKYPQHELADDVEFSLAHLGKSPEEIIREFEMKAKQQAADTAAAEGEAAPM